MRKGTHPPAVGQQVTYDDLCPQCGGGLHEYFGPTRLRSSAQWRQGYRCSECAWGLAQPIPQFKGPPQHVPVDTRDEVEGLPEIVILITFELKTGSFDKVLSGIESYENWARFSDQSYAIYGKHRPAAVRDHLWQLMGPNDQLFTAVLHAPAAWAGLSTEVGMWIRARLRAP